MKSLLFKKVTACAAALAVTMQLGLVLPASANKVQLYDDTVASEPTVAPVATPTATPSVAPEGTPTAVPTENSISYKDGKVTVKAAGVQKAVLIFAAYDAESGILSSVVANDINFNADGATEYAADLANGVKIMVWDSLLGAKPICASYTVTAAEPTITPTATATTNPTTKPTATPTPIPMTTLYERGYSTPWSADDLSEWVKSGSIADPTINDTYGLYLDTNMTGKATKTISNISDKAVVVYKTKLWMTGSTGIDTNYSYYSFGNKLVLGYNTGYKLYCSLDGGATYDTSKVVVDGIKSGAEVDVEITINTSSNTLVSLKAGNNTILENMSLGSDATYDTIDFGFLRAGSVNWTIQHAFKALQVSEYVDNTVYRTVTYSVDGETTTEAVVDGQNVAKIPNTDKLGYTFKGWKIDDAEDALLSTDDLKAMTISADTLVTAVYEYDSTYARVIKTVEFVDAKTTALTYPTEEGGKTTEEYKIKVTADTGDDITDDCTFVWDMVGNENDDSYAVMDETVTGSTNTFEITQGGDSCFGYVKVTATYSVNGDAEPMSVQIPFALVTGSKAANQIVPAAGYNVSMDYYVDNLVGYVGTKGDYSSYDIVLNNWCMVGSNANRFYGLVQDGDRKAIKFDSVGGNMGGSGSTNVATMAFSQQTEQYIFETTVKFSDSTRIGVWNKTPNNSNCTAEWSISYAAGVLTAGDQTISGLSNDKYYKVVVSSDPVNDLYSVYVYDADDNSLVNSVEGVAGGETSGVKFLCIDGGFPVYVNSLQAYTPTVDSLTVVADNDSIQVPDEGEDANTVDLVANCKTADGFKLTGAVTWSLAQEYQGVELVAGVQSAILKVSNGAAGTVDVIATIGGKSSTKTINLVNSSNVVAFKKSSSSITIPFSDAEDVVAEYQADTITPNNSEGIGDDTITYTFLDKTGVQTIETLPTGITSSVEGTKLTLTVAPNATPTVFYIKATNSEGLSTKIAVNVHGLSYQFGETVEEGYTQVTAATLYNDTLEYGFETVTNLTDEETAVKGSAAYRFKVKVPNGNYKVTVNTTSATMYSEIVDEVVAVGALMPGISKSGSSFDVAVCDGIMDLTFAENSSITSLSVAQIPEKEKREKPAIYAIGDSTTKANTTGARSWGECVTDGLVEVPEEFVSFFNHGFAGRDSDNFYYQGRVENVLLDVHPGDYVTVNMGINSRTENLNEGAAYPILMDTYYVKAIMERRAIPVIVTATPQGPVGNYAGNYSSSTGKFTCNRGTGARNNNLRKLAQQYDLNIIELGYWGDDYFNSLTDEDVAAYNEANGTSYATVIEMVQSWYPDHNHYAAPLGTTIGNYIFDCISKIQNGSTEFNQANDPHINEQ